MHPARKVSLALGLLAAALVARAEGGAAAASPEPARRPGEVSYAALDLSGEQKAKFQALAKLERADILAIRENAALSGEAKRTAIEEIRRTYRAEREKLLTPAQRHQLQSRAVEPREARK